MTENALVAAARRTANPDTPAPTASPEAGPMTPTRALATDAALEMIRQALPDVGLTPEAVQRTALTLVKQTPKLATCEADSVVQGIVRGAALGLDPDPALGQMWLVPRRTKRVVPGRGEQWVDVATFQIGYRGLLELVTRSGAVAGVTAQAVHQHDHFDATFGSDGRLEHRPDWFGDRGPLVGWYCHVKLTNGGEAYAIRSVADVEAHRDTYAPRDKAGQVYGPWADHFGAMAERTVFLAATRWLPRSITAHLARAMDADGTASLAPVGSPARPDDVIRLDVSAAAELEATTGETDE